MGRQQASIKDTGPVGKFAERLRARHEQADQKLGRRLTFRDMARKLTYSNAALARAESGEELPSLAKVEAMLACFEADETELAQWREFHADTAAAVMNLRRKKGEVAVAVYTGDGDFVPMRDRPARLRPVKATAATPEQQRLNLAMVNTFDDLRYQLEVLRLLVGNPSLRDIAAATQNTYRWISSSTLAEVFSGRRRPKFGTLSCIVEALAHIKKVKDMPSAEAWEDAWFRAEYSRTRPDQTRTQRYGNIYLISDHQDEGPTATLIAEMKPEVAAALLASMPPRVSSSIIAELVPTGRAQPILAAMWSLTGKADPKAPGGEPGVTATDADDEAV
jgi:flagellar motility protein MotE (MotC chaperone)